MFRNTRHIHLVAVGGIGMSGIAEILLNLGFEVSGSDLHLSAVTERLRRNGATIYEGHREEQIKGADVVVYSSAVTAANPEISGARSRHIPIIRRADMLAELMRLKEGIAVAGSHGKTTTTSLTAAVLGAGQLDPTVIVGGKILATGVNAVLGGGDYLLAEADESDGTFLLLTPTIAVVTNIDHEHIDFYPDMDALRAAFASFLARVPFYGACVLCADDPELRAMAPALDRQLITYGLSPEADVRADLESRVVDAVGQAVDLLVDGEKLGRLEIPVRGDHNLRNSLAAVAVGLELGVSFQDVARGLASFRGVGRRCEMRGEHAGVLVLDDYGHHPTEILATMQVARSFERPVAVLFQPHRYSRTERFQREFGDALAGADKVGLLPVYAASEEPIEGVNSGLISAELEAKGHDTVDLLSGHEAVDAWLDERVVAGDLLAILGAGDIGRLVDPICERLDGRPG